jgi:hypothetical protein
LQNPDQRRHLVAESPVAQIIGARPTERDWGPGTDQDRQIQGAAKKTSGHMSLHRSTVET